MHVSFCLQCSLNFFLSSAQQKLGWWPGVCSWSKTTVWVLLWEMGSIWIGTAEELRVYQRNLYLSGLSCYWSFGPPTPTVSAVQEVRFVHSGMCGGIFVKFLAAISSRHSRMKTGETNRQNFAACFAHVSQIRTKVAWDYAHTIFYTKPSARTGLRCPNR